MKKVIIAAAALAALFGGLMLVNPPKAGAQGDRPARYACVIASGGRQIYYKGGFVSWSNCMAHCSWNANIRSLGGQLEIRYNCPSEYIGRY